MFFLILLNLSRHQWPRWFLKIASELQEVISDILLAIEVYMAPCIYAAMVAARDEVRDRNRNTLEDGPFSKNSPSEFMFVNSAARIFC